MRIINRTIVFRHLDIMLRLYKSLVRPHLEYCTAAWSPHYCKDKELIERVQRRFTRMIPDIKDLSYEQRLAKTKLWSLEDRRTRADLIEALDITVDEMWNKFKSVLLDGISKYIPRGTARVANVKNVKFSLITAKGHARVSSTRNR